jgi:hypothetical protein
MNERIRELAKQADIEFDVSSDNYSVDTAVVTPYDLEKFAELLIKECANIDFRKKAFLSQYDDASVAKTILEHFGVE